MTRRQTSFGHAVRPMGRAELAMQERYPRACRKKRVRAESNACGRAATHLLSFQYTGPEGRTNTATQRVCKEHAEEFAEQHKLRIPRVLPEEL